MPCVPKLISLWFPRLRLLARISLPAVRLLPKFPAGMDLFDYSAKSTERDMKFVPLAEVLRPRGFDELFGLNQVRNYLATVEKTGRLRSIIVWGPPGSGKTSFARLLRARFPGNWRDFLASELTVKDIRALAEEGRMSLGAERKQTVLFLDEIHRLNRGHQDALLPAVEAGTLILVGATTEHPFSALNKALLSRCQLIEFQSLTEPQLRALHTRIQAALRETATAETIPYEENWITPAVLELLIHRSNGDARVFIGETEALWAWKFNNPLGAINAENAAKILGARMSGFDPGARDHSVAISGLIKTMRSSQPQKAVAWLAYMLGGGENLDFINRRLMIFAAEDIGNADPRAIQVAVAAAAAVERVGLPEARIILSQAVTYLASAPKSRAAYEAIGKASEWVETQSVSQLQQTLAPLSEGPVPSFYVPTNVGFEKNIAQYLEWLQAQKNNS